MDRTYTVEEVADLLHVNQDTVRRYIREGKIKASAPGGRKYVITEDQVYSLLNQSESYADIAATILSGEEGRLVSEFRTLSRDDQVKAMNYIDELFHDEAYKEEE